MNKKFASVIIFIALFCLSSLALAISIPDPLGGVTFPQLLGNIAKGVGMLIAGLGTIMIIVAGIIFLTSAGSPTKMETGKKALIYAIVGIAIGLAAQAIVDIIWGLLKGTT